MKELAGSLRWRAALLVGPAVVTLLGFFVLPLGTMIRESVLPSAAGDAGGAVLTIAQYRRFFSDPFYLSSLGITVGTALLVVIITAIASYPMALAYSRASRGWKSLWLVLLLSPFYANIVVKVFGWMILLARFGLVNDALLATGLLAKPVDFLESYAGIVIVLVHRSLPFMVLLIAAALDGIDSSLVDSAQICGSSGLGVFRRIVLPLSVPGLLAGSVLVFSLTVATFVIPLLVGGTTGERFVSVLMYRAISVTQDWPFGAAVGTILLGTSVLTIALGTKLVKSIRLGRLVSEGFVR